MSLQKGSKGSLPNHKGLDDIPTDGFGIWLEEARQTQLAEKPANVPCGECRGCCTSSYFIHIQPEENETLARIPKKLLFPAPGLPPGNVLLGYGKQGHCPLFIDNQCSIYQYRPKTCRKYDCRIFTATGLMPEGDQPKIMKQVGRWKFGTLSKEDQLSLAAVQSAARFLVKHAARFPNGFVPKNPAQQAVLALLVYKAFLPALKNEGNESSKSENPDSLEVSTLIKAIGVEFKRCKKARLDRQVIN